MIVVGKDISPLEKGKGAIEFLARSHRIWLIFPGWVPCGGLRGSFFEMKESEGGKTKKERPVFPRDDAPLSKP